jgi:small-conductance mechanosensitive channel
MDKFSLKDIGNIFTEPLFKLGNTQFTLERILVILVCFALVFVFNLLLRRFVMQRLLKHTRFDSSLQYAIGKITGYIFVALGCYIVLQVNDVNLSSLAVIGAAIGVGLGFGLQNIISNFVSGLIILAERPISIGDRVEVGKVAGQVVKISLRSTTILTNDNISIIVPNSDFISSSVTNWNHGDPRVRMRLPVGVGYSTNPEELRRILIAVAKEHPKVLSDPGPDVFFLGFGDSSLNFELAVWTSEMTSKPRSFCSDLYYAMEKTLRENKIELPFPQRDIHIKPDSVVSFTPPPKTEQKIEPDPKPQP